MNCVYDIDGTITKEDIDLWYLFSSRYSLNKKTFSDHLLEYKLLKKDEPFNASKRMMEKTIKNLPSQIENCMDHFIDNLDISKLVRKDAILSLKENSNQGSIYFATTNYQDLAFRFIQKVSQHYNIKNIEKVNGSIINWNHRSIQHFNCGPLKLIHLNHLKIIDLSYGDDPFYNDAYILNAAKKGFTITTKKNTNYNTNYRLNWN